MSRPLMIVRSPQGSRRAYVVSADDPQGWLIEVMTGSANGNVKATVGKQDIVLVNTWMAKALRECGYDIFGLRCQAYHYLLTVVDDPQEASRLVAEDLGEEYVLVEGASPWDGTIGRAQPRCALAKVSYPLAAYVWFGAWDCTVDGPVDALLLKAPAWDSAQLKVVDARFVEEWGLGDGVVSASALGPAGRVRRDEFCWSFDPRRARSL